MDTQDTPPFALRPSLPPFPTGSLVPGSFISSAAGSLHSGTRDAWGCMMLSRVFLCVLGCLAHPWLLWLRRAESTSRLWQTPLGEQSARRRSTHLRREREQVSPSDRAAGCMNQHRRLGRRRRTRKSLTHGSSSCHGPPPRAEPECGKAFQPPLGGRGKEWGATRLGGKTSPSFLSAGGARGALRPSRKDSGCRQGKRPERV